MCAQDRPSGNSEWQIFGDSGAENDSPVVATAPDGAIVENIYCLQGGYNLRGLSGDPVRCPECGEKNSLGSAAIPARYIESALRNMNTTPTRCVAFSFSASLHFQQLRSAMPYLLEHLTVKCIVSAASEIGAAFVCIYGTERFADGLDQSLDASRRNAA